MPVASLKALDVDTLNWKAVPVDSTPALNQFFQTSYIPNFKFNIVGRKKLKFCEKTIVTNKPI